MTRVLFVCLGNICRSPLAEAIFRRIATERGLDVEVDSAGTGDWHVGSLPDRRACQVGQASACRMDMRARQFHESDFERFDYIVPMDIANQRDLHRWTNAKPEKVRLMLTFDPQAVGEEVPDPYYGHLEDFREVAAMLETACRGLADEIEANARK
ncbi:low molecular weight phosphotyrosine protein phosphatase [bacterium]|nr:MAG: low molecular weight phosphotyrosine protein phosphatase [bacterium]